MRTDWTPLLREFQPRFSEDSEIELPSIKPNLLPDNSELKMSFSFDHDHYVTEWISIANGNGKFLNSLRFFLTYSGDHITDVSWKLVRLPLFPTFRFSLTSSWSFPTSTACCASPAPCKSRTVCGRMR